MEVILKHDFLQYVFLKLYISIYIHGFSKKTMPRDMLFSRHADLFVRLFPGADISEVPPPKVSKFQLLITNFLLTIE